MPLIEAAAVLLGFVAFSVFARLKDRVVRRGEYLESVRRTSVFKESTDVWGCTELHLAACARSSLEVRRLLEGGSDPNARDAWCETPLHMASRLGHLESAKLLLLMGAEVHATNADDETPLMLAARAGHKSLCKLLLDSSDSVGNASIEDVPPQLGSLLLGKAGKAPDCAEHSPLPTLLGHRAGTVQNQETLRSAAHCQLSLAFSQDFAKQH